MSARRGESGQALVLLVGVLCAVLVGALALGSLANAIGERGRAQRAADLGALAGAKAMRSLHARLFVPATVDGRPNPEHVERAAYLRAGRDVAAAVARANGADAVRVAYPDADPLAPVVIRVAVGRSTSVRVHDARRALEVEAEADAQLTPEAAATPTEAGPGDEYRGPLAHRQGKPMRPDVAQAFDRLHRAARADGVDLIVTSAFRSNAEQARLFAARPDPRWVAPPGKSLHRLGTELDLGPPAAYGWLARNAKRFHFVQRYSWEPWHYGYTLNAGSAAAVAHRRDGDGHGALPSFVPERYAAPIARAAQRWNVSATLLAAQLYQESRFNPFARSPAGAQGIAQFMPGTAAAYGLRNPFDAGQAIDAQARMMRDLLRRFGAVDLALAAYNAGPGRVARCGCVPPIPETLGYVAAILGLMRGAGDPAAAGGLAVRLVR
jgi:Transglycosylase SLT domain/D-alanyl-D-alanine carboxypeptidase/Putative Flp pilus-assembly TadE/G-like